MHLLEKSHAYKEQFLEEIEFQRQLERELDRENIDEENQSIENRIREFNKIKKEAEEAYVEDVGTSKRERTSKIKENRKNEREQIRKEQQFEFGRKKRVDNSEVVDIFTKEFIEDDDENSNVFLLKKETG